MSMYFLSKGHKEFTGSDDPFPYQKFKIDTHNYEKSNGTLILGKKRIWFSPQSQKEIDDVHEKRNSALGSFIEYIDPCRIVNNVLQDRPLLHSERMKVLKESVLEYGVLSPILVHIIWGYQWRRHRIDVKPDGKPFYIVKEGRHRALATELVGHTKPIPAWVLIPVKEKQKWEEYQKKSELP